VRSPSTELRELARLALEPSSIEEAFVSVPRASSEGKLFASNKDRGGNALVWASKPPE
jgi:hypothetical protein